MRKIAVIDTNVIVSGAIVAGDESPAARILNQMLKGEIAYLMSEELLTEYAGVLRRPRIAALHQLPDADIDKLLARIVVNAIWREPAAAENAPDPGDGHLWRLLASEYGSILITGDKLLLGNPPSGHSVVSPRSYIESPIGDMIHEPPSLL